MIIALEGLQGYPAAYRVSDTAPVLYARHCVSKELLMVYALKRTDTGFEYVPREDAAELAWQVAHAVVTRGAARLLLDTQTGAVITQGAP